MTFALTPTRSQIEKPAAIGIAAFILVAAIIGVYARALSAPFIFDDFAAIVNNASIRRLTDLPHVLSPPHAEGNTVGGRPLLNLSFAVNYAISGPAPTSYRALNLLIHACSGLLLFGIVRRAGAQLHIAFITALVWSLHPLQTESVAYVVQRAESLAGFWLLSTLYAFIRGIDAPGATAPGWFALSAFACLLGMATKETMVGAPLLVLLYDRTMLTGTFRVALGRRPIYYGALATTWLLLAALVVNTGASRGDTAGLGTTLSPWTYALTQCRAIFVYLRLAAWPWPQTFDYGNEIVAHLPEVWWQLPALLCMLIAAVVAIWRRSTFGLLAGWFFLTLAPSSSVLPIASQTMAEHRMYLPLVAVIVGIGAAAHRVLGQVARAPAIGCAAACALLTLARVEVYRSDLTLSEDTVAHAPNNARAQSNLGNALLARHRTAEAIVHYETALRLRPDYADAHNNFGRALVLTNQVSAAIPHYEEALRIKPTSIDVLTNLGSALFQTGKSQAALSTYDRALEIAPDAVAPRYNRANALLHLGDFSRAIRDYQQVLSAEPAHADARFNLAAALVKLGQVSAAITQYQELLRFTPADPDTHAELANLLAHQNRNREAVVHYETALRLRPDFAIAREQLARLRAMMVDK